MMMTFYFCYNGFVILDGYFVNASCTTDSAEPLSISCPYQDHEPSLIYLDVVFYGMLTEIRHYLPFGIVKRDVDNFHTYTIPSKYNN